MRGSVSFEYALILIALLGLYSVLLNFYLNNFSSFQIDAKRFYGARISLLKLKSAGYFAQYWTRSREYVAFALPGGVSLETNPLLAEINVFGEYNGCKRACTLGIPQIPFTENNRIVGKSVVVVYKEGREVGIR